MTRLGSKVIEAHGVGHRYGEGPPLFRGLDLILEPGDHLGIVGPNGAGKTTLLDILAGRLKPAEGRVEHGTDRQGRLLRPARRRPRSDHACPRRGRRTVAPARLVRRRADGAVLVRDDAQWAPIGLLSGGERRRLQLLMVLAEKPNVLLLDEPTNDLDLDTLRVLEDFLEDWPGTLLVVSHDRAFLERTVEECIAVDGPAGARTAQRVRGGYAGWLAARRHEHRALGLEAPRRPAPHPVPNRALPRDRSRVRRARPAPPRPARHPR